MKCVPRSTVHALTERREGEFCDKIFKLDKKHNHDKFTDEWVRIYQMAFPDARESACSRNQAFLDWTKKTLGESNVASNALQAKGKYHCVYDRCHEKLNIKTGGQIRTVPGVLKLSSQMNANNCDVEFCKSKIKIGNITFKNSTDSTVHLNSSCKIGTGELGLDECENAEDKITCFKDAIAKFKSGVRPERFSDPACNVEFDVGTKKFNWGEKCT